MPSAPRPTSRRPSSDRPPAWWRRSAPTPERRRPLLSLDMTLEGRVALVTGGSRGIGRAIALALAADGADVAINYRRDEEAAKETVGAIEGLGRRGAAYQASIDSVDEDQAMVDGALSTFGHVDILVNNAGIASRGNTVADTDPAELARVVGTHALGAHHMCRMLLPQMRKHERGDIVMISSVATREFAGGGAPYNMAKAALEALAMTLAKEEKGRSEERRVGKEGGVGGAVDRET